jgi:ribonucleoside-diphosphate reductase beta chain
MSFDNPEEVMKDVLAVKESMTRLGTVAEIFAEGQEASHLYARGKITVSEAYDKVLMMIIALLLLERVQFMASFAITFTICKSNVFQAIGKAVAKIAQDELEIHAELDKEVLRIELSTERGRESFNRQKDKINRLFHEVLENEFNWTDNMFSEGRELVGSTAAIVKKWVLYNAKDVAKLLEIETELKFPTVNPMPHLDDWLDISKVQATPQEQDNNQYKVGVIVRDDEKTEFAIDF